MRILAALVSLVLAAPAWAAVPQVFTVQGVLRNSAGTLQTMPVDVNVTLYDARTDPSNTLFAPAQIANLPVTNGLFTVVLTIPDATTMNKIAAASEIWLGLTAGGDTFPRQKVTPVVSALLCGNADTVTNGVYTNGSYADPAWITSLSASKISGSVASASTVTNGVVTTGSYADPAWITSLSGSKISGAVASADALSASCSGCVTNAKLASGIDVAKLSGVLPIANGGTGSATQSFVDLSGNQTAAGNKTWSGTSTFSGAVAIGAAASPKVEFGLTVESNNGAGYAAVFSQDSATAGTGLGTVASAGMVQGLTSANTAAPLSLQPAGGNVGIGTASPNYLLHLKGAGATVLLQPTSATNQQTGIGFHTNTDGPGFSIGRDFGNAGNHDFFIYDQVAQVARIYLNSSGQVGIGTTTQTHLVQLSGGAYSDGASWTNASSRDYKEAIRPLADPLPLLEQVEVYRYRYRAGHGEDRRERIGVIAEQLPALVASPDRRGAPTGELIALSLAANRALLEKIRRLEREKRAETARVEALARRLDALVGAR
jgi:hypothetical protein